MLDFLNDLKMRQDLSSCSENEDPNAIEELGLSPCPKLFPALEPSQNLAEFFSKEEKSLGGTEKKKIKKRRGNKKDDFDYNKYIEKELKKQDTSKMDSCRKKKLIQKIRNRMSAQRSRLRQKRILSDLEVENNILRQANENLTKQVLILEQENEKLKSNVGTIKPENKFSIFTDDSEKDLSHSASFCRKQQLLSLNTELPFKPFFIFALIFALMIFSGSSLQ